jgi:hypothetical protein
VGLDLIHFIPRKQEDNGRNDKKTKNKIKQEPRLNKNATHLSMKEGSLFCFVIMRSTKPGCFRSCLLKALNEEG